MPKFVSMVQYRDYLLALTEDGDLWKIWEDPRTGVPMFQKVGRLVG